MSGNHRAHVVELRLPSSLEAPRDAREFTRTMLGSWGLDDDHVHTVELLTTELVANVVVHVDAAVVVRLSHGPAGLRVEVDDASPTEPELHHPAADDTHGRGVLLIDSLASRWGTEHHDGGKTVWFELDALAPDR